MSPPIRGAGTAAKLRGALAGGPLSIVATDHAVFNSTQKRAGRHDFRCSSTVCSCSMLYHLCQDLLFDGAWLC
jgi:dihydroorotase-like cyclic amidohydrolase